MKSSSCNILVFVSYVYVPISTFSGVWLWNEENNKQDTSICFTLLWSIISGVYIHFLTKDREDEQDLCYKKKFKNRNVKLLEKTGFDWFYSSFIHGWANLSNRLQVLAGDGWIYLVNKLHNSQYQQKLNKSSYLLGNSVPILSLLHIWQKFFGTRKEDGQNWSP